MYYFNVKCVTAIWRVGLFFIIFLFHFVVYNHKSNVQYVFNIKIIISVRFINMYRYVCSDEYGHLNLLNSCKN